MSKMSNILLAYAMMGAMSGENFGRTIVMDRTVQVRDEELYNKSKGLKQFFYGGNSLWAINQKNADRKAKSLKWI